MRIWDLPVHELDDQHLLGEHAELHALWSILHRGGGGSYANHPETRRWRGHRPALWRRHEEQVAEMAQRGWRGHRSPLPAVDISGESDAWPPVTPADLAAQRQRIAEARQRAAARRQAEAPARRTRRG